jgi:pimeloyl-ACP methyl ester carboxylesterase
MPADNGISYLDHESGAGNTAPLLLIHGAGAKGVAWPSSIRSLPGRRVITLDLPGHGRSEGLSRQTVLGYAQDVLEFMHALDLPPVVLCGHSMGGAICLQIALLAPRRVKAVIGISTSSVCDLPGEIIDGMGDVQMKAAAVDHLCRRLTSPLTDGRKLEPTKKSMLADRSSLLINDLRTCLDYNLESELSKLTLPVLILSGRWDQFIRPAYSRHLAQSIPGARFVSMDGGHLLPQERPDELAVEIRRFLNDIRIDPIGF